MRNAKVKAIKRIAFLSLALFMLSSGSAFSADATNWDTFKSGAQTGTVNIQNNITTDGTGLNLGAPPVPSLTINGGGNTITAGGAGASADNFIINNQGNTVVIHETNFANGNVAEGNGGAIQNSGSLTINTAGDSQSSFTNNTSVGGGAIYNTGSVNINNTLFDDNHAITGSQADSSGLGGAIYSNVVNETGGASLNISDSIFQNNDATRFGGAIVNFNGTALIDNTDFKSNQTVGTGGQAGANGGAIANRADMEISNSTFTENAAGSQGGAIYNGHLGEPGVQSALMEISNTTFTGNHAQHGGAIFNSSNTDYVNTLTINGGTSFINNYAADTGFTSGGGGGAILNNQRSQGGTDGNLIINGTSNNAVIFRGNVAGSGGAIKNFGTADVNYAVFENNGHNDDINQSLTAATGGAIHNEKVIVNGSGADAETSAGEITISNSAFRNNTAATGGAIYNQNGTVTVIDSEFSGNSTTNTAAANGGAIYGAAGSTTTLRAENRNMFVGTDTSVADGTDSIALVGTDESNVATLNLQAANGRNLVINSNIAGNDTTTGGLDPEVTNRSIINVGEHGSSTLGGTVRVNGNAQITNSTINVNGGTLSFAHDSGLGSNTNRTNVINMNGGTLDMLNYEYSLNQIQGREFNMLSDSSIRLDVDLAQERMDGIFSSNFDKITNDNDSKLTVAGMKSTSDALRDDVKILFTDADPLIGNVNLGQGANVVEGLIHKYSVNQVTQTGTGADGTPAGEYFVFNEIGNSDSSLVGAVAAQGAFLIMDNLYRQSFANMDLVTLMTPEQRMAWKMRNKYANAGYHTGVYAPNVIPEERDGWYMRPFTNFENVPLKGGPKVSNVSYGSLFGGESDIIELGHGWDGNFSLFGAYHGSHQAYNGVSIWQNGGTIGGVATAYKGNFFTGITANVGASAARATHAFGTDDFPILMTGAAWKSGYNWGLFDRKLIIQPSYMMSYTFVNVFDFTNGGGVRITQDPLHAIEIIPGIRIIGNLKNGWQPYLGVNMTWNIMDKTKFYANEVALSQLSVKPYIEYGVGLQKRYGDRFTGFGQAMIRNGGRNGIAFTLGLRWALGN